LLAFAAEAGAFAALGGQHAGVAGAGITPAQAGLQLAGQRGVIPVVRAAHDKGADRTGPDCASTGLAREAFAGVKHSPAFSPLAQRRIAGVVSAARLPMMTNSRYPSGRAARTGLSAASSATATWAPRPGYASMS
jgi:hypothetical protein